MHPRLGTLTKGSRTLSFWPRMVLWLTFSPWRMRLPGSAGLVACLSLSRQSEA